MILQTITTHSKEILALCTQILQCVEGADPLTVLLLQQQVRSLRWQLAAICLQADNLRHRLMAMTDKL